jgi:hypothetical protein
MLPNPFFLSKLMHINFTMLKSSPKFGLLLSFLEELPKVNHRPIGENSPNLVTLVGSLVHGGDIPLVAISIGAGSRSSECMARTMLVPSREVK